MEMIMSIPFMSDRISFPCCSLSLVSLKDDDLLDVFNLVERMRVRIVHEFFWWSRDQKAAQPIMRELAEQNARLGTRLTHAAQITECIKRVQCADDFDILLLHELFEESTRCLHEFEDGVLAVAASSIEWPCAAADMARARDADAEVVSAMLEAEGSLRASVGAWARAVGRLRSAARYSGQRSFISNHTF